MYAIGLNQRIRQLQCIKLIGRCFKQHNNGAWTFRLNGKRADVHFSLAD